MHRQTDRHTHDRAHVCSASTQKHNKVHHTNTPVTSLTVRAGRRRQQEVDSWTYRLEWEAGNSRMIPVIKHKFERFNIKKKKKSNNNKIKQYNKSNQASLCMILPSRPAMLASKEVVVRTPENQVLVCYKRYTTPRRRHFLALSCVMWVTHSPASRSAQNKIQKLPVTWIVWSV